MTPQEHAWLEEHNLMEHGIEDAEAVLAWMAQHSNPNDKNLAYSLDGFTGIWKRALDVGKAIDAIKKFAHSKSQELFMRLGAEAHVTTFASISYTQHKATFRQDEWELYLKEEAPLKVRRLIKAQARAKRNLAAEIEAVMNTPIINKMTDTLDTIDAQVDHLKKDFYRKPKRDEPDQGISIRRR